MDDIINDFVDAKLKLNRFFEIQENYFFKTLINNKWTIKDNDGTFFLTYIEKEESYKDCVISKKDGNPIIIRKDDYTLVVAIECVKLAFVLNNKYEVKNTK